jgi:hypothetical protein
MEIPPFMPSQEFLGEITLPCLRAEIKNSQVPGIASRHIEQYKEDPICRIYLRAKNPLEKSPWQQKMLQQLFEQEGLAAAVAEGMKEYEAGCIGDPYDDFDEDEREQIAEQGFAPFLFVEYIVIDDEEQKVLIGADNPASTLHEHGITIYLSDGHWHFADADHSIRYQNALKKRGAGK